MHIPSQAPLHLLHRAPEGTLATHARELQGFPYPTALPFAVTARHAPMLLISNLVEHTRNLQADPHAGFLAAYSASGGVLEGERVTLLGAFARASAEEHETLAQRYLRYYPEAERYLALGDFSFWVMSVECMRYIGGFGAMGWIAVVDIDPLAPFSADEEAALFEWADTNPERPASLELLGIGRYGCNLKLKGLHNRFTFDEAKTTAESLKAAMLDCFARHV
ncbi:putative heme iron utilization protein [Candidatus Burkholderia brachyanthoides]|nr:putative heme iron utilization protein [Candidatus Burkholderia brachyanthoides]